MESTSFEWQPGQILSAGSSDQVYAVVLLNRPIFFKPTVFQQLWNNAAIRVLVDGGANRFFKYMEENHLTDALEGPSYACGDLDSITEESIKRLTEMNVEIIHTPDQDHTDLTKSLLVSKPFMDKLNIVKVVILTDFSGRIDQAMSQINTLFTAESCEPFLMTHDTLAWILRPGIHRLAIPENHVEGQFWCSYIPIGSVCQVSTRGLKYDLTKSTVCFGGLISTSNTYEKASVEIECDHTLFWAMGTEKEQ